MSEIVRPKSGEGEEDLLKLQNEFFKKSIKPSVHLVNKRESEKRVSKFASKSKKRKGERYSASVHSSVLGDIKEKVPDYDKWHMSDRGSQRGFPEVFSSENVQPSGSMSVFSNDLIQQKGLVPIEHPESSEIQQISNIIGHKSFILSGPDSLQIHQENLKIISKMSDEEIRTEQENFKQSLDPHLLEFLCSRRKSKGKPSNELQMEIDQSEACDNNTNFPIKGSGENAQVKEEVLSVLQPLNQDKKWLHMDVVEGEKLLWIGDIPSIKPINPEQPYNARFDFEGLLMPYASENIDVRQGLYNHGNEPERPGYSLEELFQLSRSTVQQQRIIALNVMSKVLENSKRGYYDECFNSGLVSLLLDHDVYLLLRFALDDNTEAVLVPALSAIESLLCSEVDELCLDRALGCPGFLCQPFLVVEEDELKDPDLKNNEGELKDYQILKLDVVKGALRTDIVPRIRYIIEVLQPCPKAVLSCLHILIRLARHSLDSMQTIIQCPQLINIIVKYFVPKDWTTVVGKKPSEMQSVYNVPLVLALKLLRILSSSSHFMSDLIIKYHIMDPVMSYISIDPTECSLPLQEVLRLTLDSLYIWQKFIVHNFATQQFIDMHPIFMRLLQFHFAYTSVNDEGSQFSHEHGTALITLIEQAVHAVHCHKTTSKNLGPQIAYYHVKDFCAIIQLCLSKWLSQIGAVTKLTFSANKLVGSCFNCLAAFYSCHLHEMDVTWSNEGRKFLESVLKSFLKSSGFQTATASLKTSSCLLFKGELGSKRDPISLPSVGALMWKGECLTPVLQEKSPVPLVHGLLNFLQAIYAGIKALDGTYLQMILTDDSLSEYISNINVEDISLMASHWFTRLEVNMLALFCKLMHTKGCYSGPFHSLAFKLVSIMQRDDPILAYLMSNAIFNPNFFTDVTVCNEIAALQISDISSSKISKSEITRIALKDLPLIWDCYKSSLEINHLPSKCCRIELADNSRKQGENLLLPVDWPYFPIKTLYKQGKASSEASNDSIQLVVRTLEWLLILDELRPDVSAFIPITERFCNLSKIFLSGSDLFLDPSVHKLLSCVLSHIMQNYKEIKFSSSFYDLYTQLLEQFAAVSYGDTLFGQFLLVPLQQRHISDLRKQIWSEHAAVLRILSTPENELMFPLSEMLEPCETDYSLLQNYLQCLATGMVRENWCPILHKVALHHVSTFLCLYSDTVFAELLKTKVNRMGNKNLQSLLLNTGKQI